MAKAKDQKRKGRNAKDQKQKRRSISSRCSKRANPPPSKSQEEKARHKMSRALPCRPCAFFILLTCFVVFRPLWIVLDDDPVAQTPVPTTKHKVSAEHSRGTGHLRGDPAHHGPLTSEETATATQKHTETLQEVGKSDLESVATASKAEDRPEMQANLEAQVASLQAQLSGVESARSEAVAGREAVTRSAGGASRSEVASLEVSHAEGDGGSEETETKKHSNRPPFNPLSTSRRPARQLAPEDAVGTTRESMLCVVVTVFNLEGYIRQLLTAILAQTYDDYHIIVVDDGSTDGSRGVIDSFSATHSKITGVYLPLGTLGGAGQPTNRGIELCRSKYVAIVDGDDNINTRMFEYMVRQAEQQDADIVLANYKESLEVYTHGKQRTRNTQAFDGKNWKEMVYFYWKEKSKLDDGYPLNAQMYPKLFRLSPVPWRKLYKRQFLVDNNLRFPEGDYFFEDNLFHWQVLTLAQRVAVVNRVFITHRKRRVGQTTALFNRKADAPGVAAMYLHMDSIARHISSVRAHAHAQHPREVEEACMRQFLYWLERGKWVRSTQHSKQMKCKFMSLYRKTARKWMERWGDRNLDWGPVHKALQQGEPAAHNTSARPTQLEQQLEQQPPDYALTIVIPAHDARDNAVRVLERLFERVRKEGDRPSRFDFEVILVDDASSDGLFEATQKFQKFSNFIYIKQSRCMGAGRARNVAIPLIEGEYVFFLDADDSLDVDALWAAQEEAAAHGLDLLMLPYTLAMGGGGTPRSMFASDAGLFRKARALQQKQKNWSRADVLQGLKLLAYDLINYPWNRLAKTDMLRDNQIFFGPSPVHNDVQYHWHTVTAARSLAFFDRAVCAHKKEPNMSQITNVNDNKRLAVVDAVLLTERLLRQNHFYDGPHGKDHSRVWIKFTRHVFKWAKSRVPKNCNALYEYRVRHAGNLIKASSQGRTPTLEEVVDIQQNEPGGC